MSDLPRLLTVDDIRARLPFKIARRTLAARIRASGLAVEHRRQLALSETSWTAFLEGFKCSLSVLGRKRGGKLLVLDPIQQAAILCRPSPAPLLVMERNAVRGALIAKRAHQLRPRDAAHRTTLATRDDPVRPLAANVDRTK